LVFFIHLSGRECPSQDPINNVQSIKKNSDYWLKLCEPIVKIQDGNGRHLENKKSRYFSNCLTDVHEIWQDDAKKGLLPATTIKIYEFQKYKTVKSQRSNDFDEIWHGNEPPPKSTPFSRVHVV